MDAKSTRSYAVGKLRDNLLPLGRYLWLRFREDGCMRSSAALTYMSLFALVPLITVMFVILSSMPALQGTDEQLQQLFFDFLFPQGAEDQDAISTAKEQVSTALTNFTSQAKRLGGPGVLVLVVTAVLMLRNVESTFNKIWRTRTNRSAISSFLLYWAVLSLGPVLIGLAIGSSTYLSIVDQFFEELNVIGLWRGLLQFAPFFLTAVAFSLLYAAVPNCRVNTRHALIAGFLTAIVFNLARMLFGAAISNTSYTAIYGAFAAFPLLLLWIYLSWNIVLSGAVMSHALSAFRYEASANVPRLVKALIALNLLAEAYQRGHSISEFELLKRANARGAGLGSDTWDEIRDIFMSRRLIQLDSRDKYYLSRDLHKVRFWQLKEWITGEVALEDIKLLDVAGWPEQAQQLIREQRQSQRELMQISLADLFAQ
jgi:membrane protein